MRGKSALRIPAVILILLGCAALAAATGKQEDKTAVKGEPIHITGWANWAPGPVKDSPTFGNLYMFQVAREKFNITIDWTEATGSTAEVTTQLGLLVASGKMPDLIERIMTTQIGQDYGRQGAFIALEDLIARNAPVLSAQMKANPAYRGQTVAPDGHIYFFPRLLEDLPRNFNGFHIRQDWLDKLGLAMPQTMDELYAAFKAFRDKDPNGNGKADEIPWSSNPYPLAWAFGIGCRGSNNVTDFFVEDGRVKFGPLDPRYRDAMTLLAKWYSEKLIDNEYLGLKASAFDTKVLQDQVDACYGSYAGYLTKYNKLFLQDRKSGLFVGLPAPAGPAGIRSNLGIHMELDPACGAAITVQSKQAAAITRMMDYFYSDEGRRVLYFGKEGEHYTMQGGKPVYTDKVAKHETLAIAQYLNTYVGYISQWPSIVPGDHQLSLYDKEGKEALYTAAKTAGNRKIPILQFTTAEVKETQTLSRDLNTYIDEWLDGFIRGTKPLGDYDAFLDGLKKLNAERYTALHQTAYERYLKATGM